MCEITILCWKFPIFMSEKHGYKVTIDLTHELTAEELASFEAQAHKAGHSIQDHARYLLFGNRCSFGRTDNNGKKSDGEREAS